MWLPSDSVAPCFPDAKSGKLQLNRNPTGWNDCHLSTYMQTSHLENYQIIKNKAVFEFRDFDIIVTGIIL